jgi:hypothetical protein
MALVIVLASLLTGAIVGWWLTTTIATTIRSRSSTRVVRQWQDRALAAERWKRAWQRRDGRPDWDHDDTPRAA